MKKIMKKNQVIITSLAILIAVAGYLNFADVDLGFKDKEVVTSCLPSREVASKVKATSAFIVSLSAVKV